MSRIESFFSPPAIGAAGKKIRSTESRKLVFAGLFILIMIVLFFVALWLVSGKLYIVSGKIIRAYTINVEFVKVPGITEGAQVNQGGYAIGTVTNIEPIFSSENLIPSFKLTLRIKNGWRIPKKSNFIIESGGLLTGKVITIIPNLEQTEVIKNGDAISIKYSKVKKDIQNQIQKFIKNNNIQTIKEKITDPLMERINPTLKNTIMISESLAKILKNIEPLVDDTSGDIIGSIPKNIDEIMNNIKGVSANIKELTESIKPEFKELLKKELLEKITMDINKFLEHFKKLAEDDNKKIDHSLSEIQYILQELSTSLPSVLNNVDKATHNLKDLSRKINENPSIIIRGQKRIDNTPVQEGEQ